MPDRPLSILYLAPTFLAYRLHKTIRGVQVFDLTFLRHLADRGHSITVPAEITWRQRLCERLGLREPGTHPHIVYTPPFFKPQWNGLWAAATLRGRFDVAFVGNTTRGIIPPVDLMLRRGLFDRIIVQANRVPRSRFCDALRRWPAKTVAVSADVRSHFPEDLRAGVDVYYGITNPERFHPDTRRSASDGLIHFCVVGQLANDWKGAPLAIDAWARLAPDVRARCRLHLASYTSPPTIDDPTVIAHKWMPDESAAAVIRSMDVMLVPSTANETFSQAMVQGMLAGLPVIAYDLPVLAEKLDTGGGIVIRDAASLATAITRLALHEAERQRMGAIARQTALERYVWDTDAFIDRYLRPHPT